MHPRHAVAGRIRRPFFDWIADYRHSPDARRYLKRITRRQVRRSVSAYLASIYLDA